MPPVFRLLCFILYQLLAVAGMAQPYFQATASVAGNSILFKITPINGTITCGWTDLEFFFRNPTSAPEANTAFQGATISVNTTQFPGITIPYNGMNGQGVEDNYNNYWFGVSFNATAAQTYNQGQEYVICTITLPSAPGSFALELCHNEPGYYPHYLALTDEAGQDRSNLTGSNKFYGPGAHICSPDNCPPTTAGNNHILPLNGSTPVELINFQANKYGKNTARLEWQTAVEINFRAFLIERQAGQQWEQIGEVAAKGAGAFYVFYDEHAPPGQLYYRLKMLDLDGTFEYSPIRPVVFDGDRGLRIYPNPTSADLNLLFGADVPEEEMLVELVSRRGRVFLQRRLAATPGTSITLSLQEYHLPNGSYLLRLVSASGFRHAERVVLQAGY